MRRVRVFVKLGGSFVTDKRVPGSLAGARVTAAARALRQAVDAARRRGERLSLVLGHGAGSYGHIHAVRYGAVHGVHPRHGWEGLYKIRESMARMNLEFLRRCNEGGLYPVTVSPFAAAAAADGRLTRLDAHAVSSLLDAGQIPLLHGDVVLDSKRGFTIASTEALLAALCRRFRFDRIVMVSDTDGVLDGAGATVPILSRRDLKRLDAVLGGSGSPDVTGGMRRKVAELFYILGSGRAREARILRGGDSGRLRKAILGLGGGGTLVKP